jgi:multidrug efflux system membrane fusion protein
MTRGISGMTCYGARAAVILAVAVLLAACGEQGRHGPGALPRSVVSGVEVIEVRPVPRKTAVEAVGTVRAKTTAAVAPQIMGRLTAVPVAEGTRVAAGAVLAIIDDQTVRAQLVSAEGMVAEALAAREEVDRAIAQAEAGKELAEKTFGRYRKLLEEKVVTPQEFDEIATRRTLAVKEHERALQKRAQVDGKISQARGAADAARVQLGYAKVTAPFAGVVLEKKADAGSMAVPGVPLFVVEDPRRNRLEAYVSEAYLPLLKARAPVRVVLDDFPDREIRAYVTEVVPVIDPVTRTFTVKVDLPAGFARSGQSGRLRFAGGEGTVLSVPKRAVTRVAGSEGVFVLSGTDNVARRTVITTGAEFGDRVEVLSGLSAGSRVAVSKLDRLADGVVVEAGK